MRTIFFVLFLILCPLAAFADDLNRFAIIGKFEGVVENQAVSLVSRYDSKRNKSQINVYEKDGYKEIRVQTRFRSDRGLPTYSPRVAIVLRVPLDQSPVVVSRASYIDESGLHMTNALDTGFEVDGFILNQNAVSFSVEGMLYPFVNNGDGQVLDNTRTPIQITGTFSGEIPAD